AFGLVLNLRVGRDMEEITSDYLVRTWRVIRVNIFGDLFRFIMDFFARVLEYVDRLLYTVDEWLRFRGGESRVSAVIKAILGISFVIFWHELGHFLLAKWNGVYVKTFSIGFP
ncbi:site-2 protease family protein, partial [Bremerella sp. JC817]|uniref:site-2 protease family protein n=1 Tax=Bremerella sp. JC817 TaxID=3231756 RepID=UPI003459FD3E